MFNKEKPVRRLLYLILQHKETKNQSESVTAVGSHSGIADGCGGKKRLCYGGGGGGGGGGAFSS